MIGDCMYTPALVLSITGIVLQNVATTYLLVIAFDLKYNKFAVAAVYTIILSIVDAATLILTDTLVFSWCNPIAVLCMALICYKVSSNERFVKLGIFVSFLVLMYISDMSADVIVHLTVFDEYSYWFAVPLRIFYSLILFLIQIFFYPRIFLPLLTKSTFDKVNRIFIPIIYFHLVFLMVEAAVMVYDPQLFKWHFVPAILLLFIFMDILLYLGVRHVLRAELLEEKYKNLEAQRDREYDYIMQQVSRDVKYGRFNQDMHERLSIIRSLLSHEKNSKGIEMLNDIVTESTALESKKYSGNMAVDALFNYKEKAARKKGITMDIALDLPSRQEIRDIDICNIFSNLIDDAIKECAGEEEGLDRRIRCRSMVEKDMLAINIDYYNSVETHDKARTKLSRKIIEDIVGRYNGSLEYNDKDKKHTVTVKVRL